MLRNKLSLDADLRHSSANIFKSFWMKGYLHFLLGETTYRQTKLLPCAFCILKECARGVCTSPAWLVRCLNPTVMFALLLFAYPGCKRLKAFFSSWYAVYHFMALPQDTVRWTYRGTTWWVPPCFHSLFDGKKIQIGFSFSLNFHSIFLFHI